MLVALFFIVSNYVIPHGCHYASLPCRCIAARWNPLFSCRAVLLFTSMRYALNVWYLWLPMGDTFVDAPKSHSPKTNLRVCSVSLHTFCDIVQWFDSVRRLKYGIGTDRTLPHHHKYEYSDSQLVDCRKTIFESLFHLLLLPFFFQRYFIVESQSPRFNTVGAMPSCALC